MRIWKTLLIATLAFAPVAALVAQDDPKKDDGAKDEEGKALEKKLHVPTGWNAEKHTVDVTYDFAARTQRKDWKGLESFDKVIVADEVIADLAGMQLAVGTGVKGIAILDPIELAGDFTLEITGKQTYQQSGADVVFIFGAKNGDAFGARYGDQFIKLKKGGQVLNVTKNEPSADLYSNGHEVKFKAVRTGDELEVFIGGESKGKHKFGKKDLDGRVGISIEQQCRFTVTSFHVAGVIAKVKP